MTYNSRRRRSALLLLCSVMIWFAGVAWAQTVTLKIIETTDEHGAIFPYDFINDTKMSGSLAQVHAFVRKERKNSAQEVLLFSAGDVLQGQPAVYFYNFEKPDTTHLYARAMNYMEYDVAAVGNHDIETGHAVYDKFMRELNFPWLAANAVRVQTGEPYFPPYAVLHRKGVKIAVLGMITPGIPNWLPPKIWQGIEFLDMIETAKKWVPFIIEKEQPDLLFGLFHSGVDFTYGGQTADTPRNENAARLVAEQVPGFDIVFVGHDHHGWNMTVTNSDSVQVRILGASAFARDVAVATVQLEFDAEKNTWHKTISGEIVSMEDVKPDKNFIKNFSAEFDEIKAYVERPIGECATAISTRDAMFGNSAFVDLIHQIQMEITGAKLSVSSPLSFDAQIDSGKVLVREMFKLYKYENLLYTMTLSGKEIKDFLEYSYANWFDEMHSSEDHLLKFKRDSSGAILRSTRTGRPELAGAYFNFDSMAGLQYIVDVSKPAGKRIRILALDSGQMFDFGGNYKVAINSYRGNGGGGHLTKGAGIPQSELADRILFSTEKDLRYFLMKWIEQHGSIKPQAFGNWQVVPHDWWIAAKARDYELLYPAKGER